VEQACEGVVPEGGTPGPEAWVDVEKRAEESVAASAGASVADVLFSDLGPGLAVDGREGARMAALAVVALLSRPESRGGAAARQEQRRRL
jgi:hypothetical protein